MDTIAKHTLGIAHNVEKIWENTILDNCVERHIVGMNKLKYSF